MTSQDLNDYIKARCGNVDALNRLLKKNAKNYIERINQRNRAREIEARQYTDLIMRGYED